MAQQERHLTANYALEPCMTSFLELPIFNIDQNIFNKRLHLIIVREEEKTVSLEEILKLEYS